MSRRDSRSLLLSKSASQWPWWCGTAVLIVLVFAASAQGLRAGFIWDDDAHLTTNHCIVGPYGFKEIWTTAEANYFPLVLTTFWVVHKAVGLNPAAYHVLNIALHATNSVLLWLVLRRLRVSGAWVGAAVWALHPVQVETTAWISETINTQGCFFFLLSLLCYITWIGHNNEKPVWWSYALAITFATCSLLSKPSTVGVPVVLGLLVWWLRRRMSLRDVVALGPFFLISMAMSAWTIWEQKYHSGALGADWNHTLVERILIAGHVFWFYPLKLIWPVSLSFVYTRWQITPGSILDWVPLFGVIVLGIALFKLRNSGPAILGLLVALGCYTALVFPVLGFFDVYYFRYSYVADHFQYVPGIAIIALAVAVLARLVARQKPQYWTIVAALVFSLAALTRARTAVFRDSVSLWRATLATNATCFLAWNNIGIAALQSGNYDEAVVAFRHSVACAPQRGDLHFNLGKGLFALGDIEAANAEYRATIRLDPTFEPVHVELGNEFSSIATRRTEAISEYEQALKLMPNDADAHSNLSVMLGEVPDRLDEAIYHARTAVQLNPASAATHMNFGILLSRIPERRLEAVAEFQTAVGIDARYTKAYINLGLTLSAISGRLDGAITAYENAIRCDPNSAIAHNDLAVALAKKQMWKEALEHLHRAVEIDPNFADARANISELTRVLSRNVPDNR